MSSPDLRRPGQPESENLARIEPWFVTMLASIVPALAAFALPESVRLVFFIASGLLFVAGCVMLYRQETQSS
jgi:hypothetical protein